MDKKIIALSLALALAVGAWGNSLLSPAAEKFGIQTNVNRWISFDEGIRVDNTEVISGTGGFTALVASIFTAADFSGELEAALIEEGTIVTRTAGATTTISAANVCDANIVQWAPLVALASTTLPTAVDVIADCLTTNGDTITFLFRNTTSTSLTSVLAADASTTLVGSAATDDQIDGGNEALITFWRTGSDTAVVEIEELVAAD